MTALPPKAKLVVPVPCSVVREALPPTTPSNTAAPFTVKASVAANKPAPIELHIMQSVGHTIHATAHDEAAAWIAGQLK